MKRRRKEEVAEPVASELEEVQSKASKRKQNKNNNEILMMLYLFIGIFILCIGYYSNFLIRNSSTVINNSYNKRADLLAETIYRGEILSSDYEKLAYSVDNGDGTETRVYPYGSMFAHVVGRFKQTKTGLEASQDFTMLTSSVNVFETMYYQLTGTKSPGNNIVTTLNVNLQKIAYDALGNRKGAVVVMEPGTGKILAMVSKPDYDPNTVLEDWATLIADENGDSPLLNRATQGLYPPGSTFKIVTLLSFIRQNDAYDSYSYQCTGEEEFADSIIHCYNNKAHGEETLKQAFANSCNTAFANIGTLLDISAYRSLCDSLLFNATLPVDFAYKKSSFVLTKDSTEMDITQTVIGQGKTLMTPLHNAMLVSAIANGGNVMVPYLVSQVENTHGNVISKTGPKLFQSIMTAKEAEILTEYMQEVVESGTASSLKNSNYTVAGKTGTAEVGSNETAHAWFVGFAPTEQPEIVVSILVENAGAGSEYAVPIAKKIFEAYLSK